jgi:hypothetical protein
MASSRKSEVEQVAGLRYWRVAEARVVVDAWRRSGEALGAFAERYGIHRQRLSRWATRLEEPVEAVTFHPVRLTQGSEREPSEAPLEIDLGEGCRVRVAPGFDAADLARVLDVLGVGARC